MDNIVTKITLGILAVFLIAGVACTHGPTGALLYASNDFAGTINTSADIGSTKTGEACAVGFLASVAFGEAGAGDAAADGGINRIATIDYRYTSVLGGFLYHELCTVVTGE